ncbi:PAS domain S-box protein [Candidatus Poribacteria bacterium]|nr:PAS domain S-box protein [Candidatus Poribacteria bacterium]
MAIRRNKVGPKEDFVKKALDLLQVRRYIRTDSTRANGSSAGSTASNGEAASDSVNGEVLLQTIDLMLDERREMIGRSERMQKEFAVFRQANLETSAKLEKKIEEISLLRLVTDATGRVLLSLDPFKLILEKVITIVNADSGSMMLANPETGRLELHTATEEKPGGPGDPLSGILMAIANRVAASGKPFFIDDAQTDPFFSLLHENVNGVGALALFPLVVEGATVGVLTTASAHPGQFGLETERIMHIIAGQIAVAVQNARLYGEVRKTKEYLENLVERAGDAIFTLDLDHTIVSWNKGAELIFKRDKQEALGSSMYFFVSEDDAVALREKVRGVIDSEDILTVEIDAKKGDGRTTQVALTFSPIRGADGKVIGVSGIGKDISERKGVEEELRRLNEAKTNFVSTVSHELRTPLTSIKSFTEVLLHDMTSLSEDTVKRYLTIINEECDHLTGLISSLLDLQKLSAGKLDVRLEPLLFEDVIRQAVDLFENVALQDGIELSMDSLVPGHMTRVLGDRKRLMQILSNLLSNALKYTEPRGYVRVSLAREDLGVRLSVSDNGIGIPAGERDKIFENFYRVDNAVTRSKGGTGLGLAITKELVMLHGGQIWVDSREGKGCCFNIVIPAADAEGERRKEKDEMED